MAFVPTEYTCEWDSAGGSFSKRIHEDHTLRCIQLTIFDSRKGTTGHGFRQHCTSSSVVVDGTRDATGKEQESICVRYVTDDLLPAEAFLGFYEAESTTGESLRRILLDVLCRLQLPVEKLRG